MAELDIEPPKPRFRYKGQREYSHKLNSKDNPKLLEIIHNIAGFRHTQAEAAAVLGVAVSTFKKMLATDQDIKDAWDSGKEMCKASARRLVFMHAQEDASTARYLANNMLGWSNDPSKLRAMEAAAAGAEALSRPSSRDETMRRIQQLQEQHKQLAPPE